MSTTCKGCKHARWLRTKSGALHPSGQGQCYYPVVLPVLPVAMKYPGYNIGGTGNEPPRIEPGYIWRHSTLHKPCPCFEPEKKGGAA